MKQVTYVDEAGRKFLVRVPDNCPENLYSGGILLGPPALTALKLPLSIEVALNNQLFHRGILTKRDALARPKDLFAAWQATLRVNIQEIQRVYQEEENG
jgi:hypothetical protein